MIRDVARYIAVGAGLLVGAVIAVSLVWALLMVVLQSRNNESERAPQGEVMPAAQDEGAALESLGNEPAITFDVETLPETQQKALTTFGFEGQTITISDSQLQCAEEALGKERLAEIIAGDSPGPIEMSKLYGCKDQ